VNKGQSLLEVVFAIVLVGLVLTGVVSLIVKSSASQTKSMVRDKAVALAKEIVERKVAESKNNPVDFWAKTDVEDQTETGYDGYTYDISHQDSTGGDACFTTNRCVEMVVTVNWQEETSQSVEFRRFFSR